MDHCASSLGLHLMSHTKELSFRLLDEVQKSWVKNQKMLNFDS